MERFLFIINGRLQGEKRPLDLQHPSRFQVIAEDGAGIQLRDTFAMLLHAFLLGAEHQPAFNGIPQWLYPDDVPRNEDVISFPVGERVDPPDLLKRLFDAGFVDELQQQNSVIFRLHGMFLRQFFPIVDLAVCGEDAITVFYWFGNNIDNGMERMADNGGRCGKGKVIDGFGMGEMFAVIMPVAVPAALPDDGQPFPDYLGRVFPVECADDAAHGPGKVKIIFNGFLLETIEQENRKEARAPKRA